MNKRKVLNIFKKMPTLRTERLTLRKLLTSDSADMYEYSKRSDVTKPNNNKSCHLLFTICQALCVIEESGMASQEGFPSTIRKLSAKERHFRQNSIFKGL